MTELSEFDRVIHEVFEEESLYAFAPIDKGLAEKSKCKRALVTIQSYPDLEYNYDPFEFHNMFQGLSRVHSDKLNRVKEYLDANEVLYAAPPASPPDDGKYRAEFSYKWAAIHAGLGFIGKNDVFVHFKYGQRVKISCLLVDVDAPCYTGDIRGYCGDCDLCVKACPRGYISGAEWDINIRREELVDYIKCAAESGQTYQCAYCSLACGFKLEGFFGKNT